ncbi:unnamed protein product [Rangifer tarandus platyrhynchus]|uniref:Uncharacterized protein n=3 Tax=Rangifer tarandus platyrhynchus TaxID=3082113 RepID=A0ACB0ER36_RANTA|nr:unnamed protein product [Rangifer tarandus platyrhynchus]CAI9703232.1 unnamed protein product [Rangifer tarandus platyrhynchus]
MVNSQRGMSSTNTASAVGATSEVPARATPEVAAGATPEVPHGPRRKSPRGPRRKSPHRVKRRQLQSQSRRKGMRKMGELVTCPRSPPSFEIHFPLYDSDLQVKFAQWDAAPNAASCYGCSQLYDCLFANTASSKSLKTSGRLNSETRPGEAYQREEAKMSEQHSCFPSDSKDLLIDSAQRALNSHANPCDEIICPDEEGTEEAISLWSIISKVRIEACMLGIGTAIGELPPYFMARAARLSGAEPDDGEYQEFEEMLEHAETAQDFASRAKLAVQNLVQKVGFFGILACASIPNPLFDLAGITCGHFLVPFWTFFGATLIGKAIIKMHIQKIFVIVTFSKHIVEQMVAFIGAVPGIGPSLQKPFQEYLEAQQQKLHHRSEMGTPQGENWLSWMFEKLVVVMVCYFILSIINSMAQSYAKRIQQKLDQKEKTK